MASSLTASWRSFWHTMTSNDRHASPDAPYRSSSHLPLGQNRHSPLTSVTTAAMESRTELNTDGEGFVNSSSRPMSPLTEPYHPGMRSVQRQNSSQDTSYSANGMGNADVPMQSFSEGLPPPPPVQHSWTRIDRWLEDNYEELFENLGEGCTNNDVNELEHELDISLPQDVRESLQFHDGQERGGRPTGVIFGCMLLDCEEIVQEYRQWARTNEEYLREGVGRDHTSYAQFSPTLPSKAFAGAATASSSSARAASPTSSTGSNWRSDLLSRQDSQPPHAIQKAYVHAGWIPLARDWGGNNICVDLSPGPAGNWGQIILMGRDYDCKYVVARSWAAFIANVADDLSTPKPYIDEETQELKLREFPRQNVSPAYMDILRWRTDQKHGRKMAPRQQSGGPGGERGGVKLHVRPNGVGMRQTSSGSSSSSVKNEFASLNGFSPYANSGSSPVLGGAAAAGGGGGGEGRGRSPPASSPSSAGAQQQKQRALAPSPLSRVTEENTAANAGREKKTSSEGGNGNLAAPDQPQRVERLLSIDSPVIGSDESRDKALGAATAALKVDTSLTLSTSSSMTSSTPQVVAGAGPEGATGEMESVKI